MNSPFTGKPMRVHREKRTMNFRKEDFIIHFHTYECVDSGEKFEDDKFAKLNYNQLLNQYREKYRIPFLDEIKNIREKYEVSAAKMAEILGFGINSYRNYESGEVPSQANAKLIQLADDPHEFMKLVSFSSSIDGKARNKIERKVEHLIQDQKHNKSNTSIKEYLLGNHLASSTSGYKRPDFEKFTEMVVFFTEKLTPWKTKLNKLLFYSDFCMFRETDYSMSGVQYRAISMGPVPNNFNSIFDYLAREDYLDIYYTTFPDGNVGEQFMPFSTHPFNSGLFTEQELSVLNAVAEKFSDTTIKEMIELSHKENAWIENQAEHNIIDYSYAFDLSQI